ncbi:uncharacterized protein [Nicotiana tomentosiformis]|uniref:uncharacterized protein n=1 Tax=Nicotiana tomentosiformis TaxID=4098 RepID=UPI0008782CC3
MAKGRGRGRDMPKMQPLANFIQLILEEFPTVMPLWVKFPKLPMSCWGAGSLSMIASVIGTLVFDDECATKQTRVKSRRSDIDFLLTVVYGYNRIEQRRIIWDTPQQLSLSITVPWMITGDCNVMLYPNVRLSGNPVSYSEIQDFTACLQNTTLIELPWKEYDDFSQLVTSIWSSHSPQGSLKSVWPRLKDLNLALKSLNSKEFRGITHKIEKARIELSDIQGKFSQDCTDTLLNMEKKVILNLEKWSLIEESVLQQKAIAKWIQLGDSNSKYFTAMMKDRSQEKQIIKTTTLLGDKPTDLDAIKREIVDFYKSLMGTAATTLPAINKTYMKHGPTLSHQQRVDLYTEVTNQVIVGSLKAIGDDKAPGINGFNAVFFKKV